MDQQTDDSKGLIIPPALAVKAMRDSGYRNTAYALAELIDNSIQANATEVELICLEQYEQVGSQTRLRLSEIATVDNGEGMTAQTLAIALQFGNGTHLSDRAGIGRFGMGLPNSSISQCRRLEVWTWKNGPENALYSYLDVEEIEGSVKDRVPEPTPRPVPQEWRNRSQIIGASGTLVVWSRFEEYRLTWRGASATLRNTETLVGRMYRKFINDGRVTIHLVQAGPDGEPTRRAAVVNDPLYLMENSSTPAPFDQTPMFQKWGERDEEFPIQIGSETHTVWVRCSYATQATVPEDGLDRGRKPYGKHAAKNLGLSIVREGRELDLDTSWTNSYDPTERWWGVEIEFPSALDEQFGVTNNKQSATILSQLAQYDWRDEAEPNELQSDFCDRLTEEGDPRGILIPVVEHIREQIKQLRKRTKEQVKSTRGGNRTRHDQTGPEDTATSKFKKRAEDGHTAEGDAEEFDEAAKDEYEKDLKDDKDYPENEAADIAEAILKKGRKVSFLEKAMEGYAFFNVESKQGGVTNVVFNSSHPFYEQLIKTLHPNTEDDTERDLLDRVNMASDTLKIVFSAWARYEIEEARQRGKLADMRQEWGKMTRDFLQDGEDD